nr:hypothetical protein CFP56_10133 [Quercus suber]
MVSVVAKQTRVPTHLTLRVRPGTDQHTQRQQRNTQYLQCGVPFSSQHACDHGRYTSEATEDDVHRNTNAESESPIVEHVDADEKSGEEEPSLEGDS